MNRKRLLFLIIFISPFIFSDLGFALSCASCEDYSFIEKFRYIFYSLNVYVYTGTLFLSYFEYIKKISNKYVFSIVRFVLIIGYILIPILNLQGMYKKVSVIATKVFAVNIITNSGNETGDFWKKYNSYNGQGTCPSRSKNGKNCLLEFLTISKYGITLYFTFLLYHIYILKLYISQKNKKIA